MSRLSRPAIEKLVHQALVARVRVLLGQSDFEALMSEQLRVAEALARGAWPWHGPDVHAGSQALAQAVLDAFALDPVYYGGCALDHIVSEGLAAAGQHLAEAVRGHEQDDQATWREQVVPQLERIQAWVVSVFAARVD